MVNLRVRLCFSITTLRSKFPVSTKALAFPKHSIGYMKSQSTEAETVVKHVLSESCKSIAFLTGAGMSVSAGIPDFRSPGGMYDTLRPELLTATAAEKKAMAKEPTTVVSWDLFSKNQLPYLEVRRPLIRGVADRQWKATDSHLFVRACHDRGLLRRLYTQNIDGIDFQTGVPEERIVCVHGTMGTVSCEFCGAPMPMRRFRDEVLASVKDIYGEDPSAPAESRPVPCGTCGRPGVKPDTVLYGRALPQRFFDYAPGDMADLSLLFVAGTSLTVSPANSLVQMVPPTCLRVAVNKEPVGADLGLAFGPSGADVFLRGSCDEIFNDLTQRLGWTAAP